MIETRELTAETAASFQTMYGVFQNMAEAEYGWHDRPIDFDALVDLLRQKVIRGLLIVDGVTEEVQGFLLYMVEAHDAIELNVIHIPPDKPWKSMMDTLMKDFLRVIQEIPNWKTVSFPMLGIQERFVLTTHWYGFKPKGQAIQAFDLMEELSLPVLHKQHTDMPDVPEGYRFTTWKPAYRDSIAEAIYQSFKETDDALWDPRFQSLEGAYQAIDVMESNLMGIFKPEWTSIMLEGERPVGFCFLVQTGGMEANIALIGLHPDIQQKGLGKQLLRHNLMTIVQGIVDKKWMVGKITATMSTDFPPAIHLYRRFGFIEQENYPHAYLTHETAANSYYGRAIFSKQSAGCCHSS